MLRKCYNTQLSGEAMNLEILFNKLRFKNCLIRANINSFKQLLNIPRHRIEHIRGLGKDSMLLLDEIYMKYNLEYAFNDEYVFNLSIEEKYLMSIFSSKLDNHLYLSLINKNVYYLGDLIFPSRRVLKETLNLDNWEVDKIEKYFSDIDLVLYKEGSYMFSDLEELLNKDAVWARVLTVLSQNKVYTLNDLKMKSFSDIKKFRNLGDSSINKIKLLSEEYDFEFIDEYLFRTASLNPELFYNFLLEYFPLSSDEREELYKKGIYTFGQFLEVKNSELSLITNVSNRKKIIKLHNYFINNNNSEYTRIKKEEKN